MSKFIGITIGDINGIGIHILIKSWKQKKIKNFILFCNKNEIEKFIDKNKYKIKLNVVNLKNKKINYIENKINIFSYKTLSSEDNTYKSLKYAYKYCANNFCKGLITLPIRKDLIKTKINKKFIGQTEYFQNLDKKYSNMILYHKKIIVSPITHILKLVSYQKQFLIMFFYIIKFLI